VNFKRKPPIFSFPPHQLPFPLGRNAHLRIGILELLLGALRSGGEERKRGGVWGGGKEIGGARHAVFLFDFGKDRQAPEKKRHKEKRKLEKICKRMPTLPLYAVGVN
jgi:hypothetical protein